MINKYMEKYRKKLKPTKVDLKIDERQRLDEIVKKKKITIAEWMRQHLEEDYKNL